MENINNYLKSLDGTSLAAERTTQQYIASLKEKKDVLDYSDTADLSDSLQLSGHEQARGFSRFIGLVKSQKKIQEDAQAPEDAFPGFLDGILFNLFRTYDSNLYLTGSAQAMQKEKIAQLLSPESASAARKSVGLEGIAGKIAPYHGVIEDILDCSDEKPLLYEF